MKRLSIDDNYLVPVKSNFDGTLRFEKGGYNEVWYEVGEEQELPWKEIEEIRKGARGFFELNWIILVPTADYSASEMYNALGVGKYYPDADKFKSLDEVVAMKPTAMAKYLQGVSENYRESVAVYARGLYENNDPIVNRLRFMQRDFMKITILAWTASLKKKLLKRYLM